jgi:MoxR-like ATPase
MTQLLDKAPAPAEPVPSLEVITAGQMLSLESAATHAATFASEGIAQYDNLLIGEKRAKEMMIAGFILGGNVLLAGQPGGGKSTMLENAHRIIGGIQDNEVAFVPHRADLTAAQLVGDAATIFRETGEDPVMREKIMTMIASIITPESRVIIFDELTRGNPYVLNAALGFLAQRTLNANGKLFKMNGVELIASSANPDEGSKTTFRMPPALGSRQSLGAMLGDGDEAERDMIQDKLWDQNWKSTPELMTPIISTSMLHGIRAAVEKVPFNDEAKRLGKKVSKATRDELAGLGIKEADGRITEQIRGTSRALTLMRGRSTTNETDIKDAVEYTLTGRLAAQPNGASRIEAATERVLNAA